MRRYLQTAGAAIALLGLLTFMLFGRGHSSPTHAQIAPTIPPTPVPGTNVGTPSAVPAGQQRPSYYRTPASLAGQVIHTVFQEKMVNPGIHDPAMGQWLTTEAWERLDANGVPELVHTRTTYQDGSFRQEMLTTPTQRTVVSAPELSPTDPSGTKHCISQTSVSSGLVQNTETFIFVDDSALAVTGFTVTAGSRMQASAPSLPQAGTQPAKTFATATAVRHWSVQTTVAGGVDNTFSYDVNTDDRVEVFHFLMRDGQGAVTAERWENFGQLDAYSPASVPTSAFTLSRGGCNA